MKSEKLKVSSFAEVITGGTPSTSVKEYWDNGTIPWLNSGELNKGIITDASNFITEAGLKSSSTRMMPPETVLIALTGATTGLTALLKIDACANQSVTGILPSKKHDSKYLFYFFKTQRSQILKKAWGGAQPHINQRYIKDYIVPLPPLEDQIRIANILSKAEALISQRKESLRLLDELLKSTFLEMFGDPVRNEKDWDEYKLNEIAKVKIGPFGSLLHFEDYIENGTPLVNPTHIVDGKIKVDRTLTVSDQKMTELTSYKMKIGDIVLGRRGEIGRCAIVTKNEDGFLCGTGSIFLTPSSKLNSTFLHYFISSSQIKKTLESVAKGVTMKNLNSGNLENLNVPLPISKLQTQFAHIVEKTEALKVHYQTSLQELENLYGSLSQRAFSSAGASAQAGKGELGFREGELAMAAEPKAVYSRPVKILKN